MLVAEYIENVRSGDIRDPTTLYALDVSEGRIIAGKPVRQACKRHLNDLARPDTVYWELEDAIRAIDFFETVLWLPGSDDPDRPSDSKPFILQPWQAFIIGCLFGWKGEDGFRRFRTAYVEIGKGNGKSPMAGGIGLYLLCADKEPVPEVYAAATKMDQAKILWNDAKMMVQASDDLDFVEEKSNLLYVIETNGKFVPISSDKRGLAGLRVHGGLIDEIHEHADASVVNNLRAGTKGRRQALIFEITNSGFDKQTICWQHHEMSLKVLKEELHNDSWFAYVCSLDEGDKWMEDESCWIKTNPNLGVSIRLQYLREQVQEARDMPSNQGIVARLNFCVWTGAESPWISEEKWEKCPKPWSLLDAVVGPYKCALAADLSMRNDLTALSAAWQLPDGIVGRTWFFTPKEGLRARSDRDKVDYERWVKEGWIIATPGNTVDYSFVAQKIVELNNYFDILGLAFDPYRMDILEKEMREKNLQLPLVKHGQLFKGAEAKDTLWMPRSIEFWEEDILGNSFMCEDNPVMTMCVANAVVILDSVGNKAFVKGKATGRMDGVVSQAMAVGLIRQGIPKPDEDAEESKFERQGFMMLGG